MVGLRQGLVTAQAGLKGHPLASNSQTLRSQCSPSCSVYLESFNNRFLPPKQILASRLTSLGPSLFYFIGITSVQPANPKFSDFLFPFVPIYNVAPFTLNSFQKSPANAPDLMLQPIAFSH